VSDELDEVAARLAQEALAIRFGRNRLVAMAERREGLLGATIGLLGAAVGFVSVIRRGRGLPDHVEIRQLYERAADVGRDRADSDIWLVRKRLLPLVSAWERTRGDQLVPPAAQRLVAWVADGRPDDAGMSDIETTFAQWEAVHDTKGSPVLLSKLTDSYIEAWAMTQQS
jgi:hypothetical protein